MPEVWSKDGYAEGGRMSEQILLTYDGEESANEIGRKIKKEAESFQMKVKDISLTCFKSGYHTYYSAIAILEK